MTRSTGEGPRSCLVTGQREVVPEEEILKLKDLEREEESRNQERGRVLPAGGAARQAGRA